jgi:hypothetical protein
MAGIFGGGGGGGGGATHAGGGSRGAEGAALRATDGRGDSPSASLQASYLNELNLVPGLQSQNANNIMHPGALAMLNSGVYIDQGQMLSQADQFLKSDAAGTKAAASFAGQILQGLKDVGRGFAGSQGDQTSPEEYQRLAQEQQQQQENDEQARLAEERQRQQQAQETA